MGPRTHDKPRDSPGLATSYVTPVRRARDGRYRRTMAWSLAAAVAIHALFVPVVAPHREKIPLVRSSGYRGEIRLLPEISVLREPDEVRNELTTSAGEVMQSAFEVVRIVVTDSDAVDVAAVEASVEDVDTDPGDDLLSRLETSLPQPTSSEIVIERIVEPHYPRSAIDAGVEGVALFRIQVSTTGEVLRAWLVRSEVTEECNVEARRAIMQWRFAPYVVDGEARMFMKYYRIRFHLRDELRDAQRARRAAEAG